MKALRARPVTLFDATAAGATLSKLVFPGSYTCTVPREASNVVAAITSGGSTIGGVIAPSPLTRSLLLDFAAVGGADVSLVVEIGKLQAEGAIARPMASVTLKSITTAGTLANVEPHTGTATAGVTWRMFDLATITAKGQLGQVLAAVGGTEDESPCQLKLLTADAVFYYVLVTTLNTLTRVACVVTPQG